MTTDQIQPVITRPLLDGTQEIYRFDNGFGASVVQHYGSYGGNDGKWELAVIRFDKRDWEITYDTDITDDVIGYLDRDEVAELLTRIDSLDREGHELADLTEEER